IVFDLRDLPREIELDADAGLVTAAAATNFAELLTYLAARGLTLPVVPGTRHLTVGGAIASDVHGKNHPADGSLAHQLQSLLLCTPAGALVRVSEQLTPDLFAASLGGMGLTGVILEATLRTAPLGGPTVAADIGRTATLEEALALMAKSAAHRHAIAWIDLMSAGARFGRAVVTRTDGAPVEAQRAAADRRDAGHGAHATAPFRARPIATVPRRFPGFVLRPATVRAFNAWNWRSAASGKKLVSMEANLFPLDALGDWNRLYGERGLLQY